MFDELTVEFIVKLRSGETGARHLLRETHVMVGVGRVNHDVGEHETRL